MKIMRHEKSARKGADDRASVGDRVSMPTEDQFAARRMAIPEGSRLVWSDKENRMVWEVASEEPKDVKNAANKR